jgi:hypothetical protein
MIEQLGNGTVQSARSKANADLFEHISRDRVPMLGSFAQGHKHQKAWLSESGQTVLPASLSRHTVDHMT